MFALPLVMILLSASPSTVRESKLTRAARLMTDVELAHLADLDSQIHDLPRTSGNTALLVSSIVAMSAGILVPLVAGVIALVGTSGQQQRHAILAQAVVVRDEREPLHARLSDQQPIEGIAMVHR